MDKERAGGLRVHLHAVLCGGAFWKELCSASLPT